MSYAEQWRGAQVHRASVTGRYRALIVLGAGAGLRISEALAVTNDRVDWLGRNLLVDRQLVKCGPYGAPEFGPVNDKRNRPRTIPLPQVVIDALAVHVATFGLGPEGLLLPGHAGERFAGRPFRTCGETPQAH
jgi:integrase